MIKFTPFDQYPLKRQSLKLMVSALFGKFDVLVHKIHDRY